MSMLCVRIESCPLPFSAFSDELKNFLTREAAVGLINRVFFVDDSQRQTFFDTNITKLAGYLDTPVIYTSFGFSPRGSNVSHDDITKAFAALGVKRTWEQLRGITASIGSARVSLLDDYRNLSRTRNRSAHDPASNVPSTDLRTHIEISILIGIAVDVLTSCIGEAYSAATTITQLAGRLAALTPNFRFVDFEPTGTLVEISPGKQRSAKRYQTETTAIAGALGRSTPAYVVVRSANTMPLALA